jgi:hypothetical protein
MEKKYDEQFKVVFDAIRQLMAPPEPKKRKIGFNRNKEGWKPIAFYWRLTANCLCLWNIMPIALTESRLMTGIGLRSI